MAPPTTPAMVGISSSTAAVTQTTDANGYPVIPLPPIVVGPSVPIAPQGKTGDRIIVQATALYPCSVTDQNQGGATIGNHAPGQPITYVASPNGRWQPTAELKIIGSQVGAVPGVATGYIQVLLPNGSVANIGYSQ